MTHQAHPKGHRDREQEVQDRDGQRDPHRGADGSVEIGVREKALVIREPGALFWLEGQQEAIEERINEQPNDKERGRQDQQRHAVDASRGKSKSQGRALGTLNSRRGRDRAQDAASSGGKIKT